MQQQPDLNPKHHHRLHSELLSPTSARLKPSIRGVSQEVKTPKYQTSPSDRPVLKAPPPNEPSRCLTIPLPSLLARRPPAPPSFLVRPSATSVSDSAWPRTILTRAAVSRVKKMIQADPDVHACSNSAAFVVTVATVSHPQPTAHNQSLTRAQELFIQMLAEKAHEVVKSEKKPRRNIQYRDIGTLNPSLPSLYQAQDGITS